MDHPFKVADDLTLNPRSCSWQGVLHSYEVIGRLWFSHVVGDDGPKVSLKAYDRDGNIVLRSETPGFALFSTRKANLRIREAHSFLAGETQDQRLRFCINCLNANGCLELNGGVLYVNGMVSEAGRKISVSLVEAAKHGVIARGVEFSTYNRRCSHPGDWWISDTGATRRPTGIYSWFAKPERKRAVMLSDSLDGDIMEPLFEYVLRVNGCPTGTLLGRETLRDLKPELDGTILRNNDGWNPSTSSGQAHQ